MEHVHFVRFL